VVTAFSVRRRVTVLMGVLVVLLLGAVSLDRINIDLFPRFDFPAAGVVTEYPGAAPSEVEALVTRLVEEAMGQVARVKEITSISLEERSVVVVQFEWNTDMDFATLQMREKLDLVSSYFPDEAGRPTVMAFDPSVMPVMLVAVTGAETGAGAEGEDPLVSLRRLGTEVVKKALERVDGVASVSVIGGREEEVLIAVDRDRLAEVGLDWLRLQSVLSGVTLDLPGGSVNEEGRDLLVRSLAEVRDLSDIENLVVGATTRTVPTPAGPRQVTVPVLVKDVAEVSVSTKPVRELSRLNGEDCIVLAVRKASDANSVAVARLVEKELDALRNELPAGVDIEVTMNQADFIAKAVGLVGTNAWQGALLAALVLLVFLRDLRSVLVISLAMPLSVVATFVLMYFSDLTLNLLTVGGLALGVGMLVDNSIVVLENIFRHIEEGEPPVEAAVTGTNEVATAISASTLTTVVVFLPVVFIGGVAGTLFKELAVTVTFSLLSSLAVAVTFVPMAAATLFGGAAARRRRRRGGRGLYPQMVRGALRSRLLVVSLAAAALVLSWRLVPGIGQEFIPPMDRGEILFSVRLPPGSDLASTDEVVRRVEEIALQVPERRFVTATVGGTGGMQMDIVGSLGGGSHMGSVGLRLTAIGDRDRTVDEVTDELERSLFYVRGGEVAVESIGSFMAMAGIRPIELVIKGEDPEVLSELAAEVARVVRETPGTVNVNDGRVEAAPELHIIYDRARLAAAGHHPVLVAEAVRSAIEGRRLGTMELDGRSLDITLRYAEAYRSGVAAVEDFVLLAPGGESLPLTAVAEVRRGEGPSVIQRQGGSRVTVVSAGVKGRDLASVTRDIVSRLETVDFPEGYTYTVEGEHREMEEAFAGLELALALSVVLVYMVMASQFESLVQPFVIMFTVPLAVVGVVVALRTAGVTLSVPSFIGIIMLAGIVVNNAIVLIDFVNQLRRRGLGRDEAVLTAARTRLRPILMTATTTALALLPMAFATQEGSELARALAVAVIGGLVSATLLTLVVIPVVYTLVDDGVSLMARRSRKKGGAALRAGLEDVGGRPTGPTG